MTLASVRKVPALDRERRTVSDDDLFPVTRSSPELDETTSPTHKGHRYLVEQFHDHTETSPALTGGDNPTPNQGSVDEIGKVVGVRHEDDEELKGAEKISDHDKNRWEFDPEPTEDYEDH